MIAVFLPLAPWWAQGALNFMVLWFIAREWEFFLKKISISEWNSRFLRVWLLSRKNSLPKGSWRVKEEGEEDEEEERILLDARRSLFPWWRGGMRSCQWWPHISISSSPSSSCCKDSMQFVFSCSGNMSDSQEEFLCWKREQLLPGTPAPPTRTQSRLSHFLCVQPWLTGPARKTCLVTTPTQRLFTSLLCLFVSVGVKCTVFIQTVIFNHVPQCTKEHTQSLSRQWYPACYLK